MRLKIISVAEGVLKAPIIVIDTPIGRAIGYWRGERPIPGRAYGVEFDFELPVSEKNLALAEGVNSLSISDGEKTRVSGLVSAVDDDGLIYLRLHHSCLVMIDSSLDKSHIGSRLIFEVPVGKFLISQIGRS